jgi:hypothetical protein
MRTDSANPGYVYVLINPSFPTLIKIGRTLRDSRERARELSTTGVPTPFQVAFEIFSERHEKLETAMHDKLNDFRVNDRREFFRYPLDKAIGELQTLARLCESPGLTEPGAQFQAEDITERLRSKYGDYLRPEISTVRIVQVPGRVWLEITEEKEITGYLQDQLIHRSDLAFIAGHEDQFFSPTDDVRRNAIKFVEEFGPFSIIMTTELFHEAACKEIDLEHNPVYRRDKP